MKKTIWFQTFLVFAILTVLATPARAQSTAPTLNAVAAFNGEVKYGEWLPIWIELDNQGADVEAEVRVRVEGSNGGTVFASPVSLPFGSRKRFPLYVLPNNFSRQLEVQLVGEKGLLASQNVAVSPHPNHTFMIGLLTPARNALTLIQGITFSGQERPKQLVDVRLEELPDRMEALLSFDVLVINGIDTSSLTPAQGEALQGWVEEGGRLIIGGGAAASQAVAGIPSSLLPSKLAGSTEVETEDLTALAAFAAADSLRVPGPFVLAQVEELDQVPLVGDKDLPLAIEREVGAGKVDFIGLDLSGVPFDGWPGTQAFWQALLVPGAYYPTNTPPDMSIRQLRADAVYYPLSNMPMLDLPSVTNLSLLLGIYILLVGPVNYLILRWRKRMHFAWVTIPAITLLFSGGAFVMGYLLRGNDLILNRIAVVGLQPDGSASVTTYMGLFSPGRESYEIEVQGSGLVSPATTAYYDPWGKGGMGVPGVTGNEMTFEQGNPSVVRGVNVNQWSMQSFMTEDTWSDFGKVTADLKLVGSHLTGTVRNETAYTLKDPAIVYSRRIARLGELAPGAEVPVDLDLTSAQSQMFGPSLSWLMFQDQLNGPSPSGTSRQAEVKRAIVESVFERGPWFKRIPSTSFSSSGGITTGPLFMGWIDQAPPAVTVNDKEPAQQTTGLVYTALNYSVPDQGAFVLPPGLVPGAMTKQPRDGGMCGDMTIPSVYLNTGEAEFEFQIPANLADFQINALQFSFWSDSGFTDLPKTELYNWETAEWSALKDPKTGLNTVQDPGGLISETGVVRLRLSTENSFGKGCLFINMGLEVSHQPAQGG